MQFRNSQVYAREMKTEVHTAPFAPRHRILLVSIGVTQGKVNTYDAARFAWRVDRLRAERAELVLAHVQGLVVGIYRPIKMDGGQRGEFSRTESDP
jgi:hypothetical protein